MDFIQSEMDKEFSSIGFKNQRKNLRVLKQVGTSNVIIDKARKALAPGKRVSASGKIYWESRRNRSDKPGSTV